VKCEWTFLTGTTGTHFCHNLRNAGKEPYHCISKEQNPMTCKFIDPTQYDKYYKLKQVAIEMGINLKHEVNRRITDE